MSHYRSNLRDIRFDLFELLGRDAVYGSSPFGDFTADAAATVLEEAEETRAGFYVKGPFGQLETGTTGAQSLESHAGLGFTGAGLIWPLVLIGIGAYVVYSARGRA